jgi:hypothetical protein
MRLRSVRNTLAATLILAALSSPTAVGASSSSPSGAEPAKTVPDAMMVLIDEPSDDLSIARLEQETPTALPGTVAQSEPTPYTAYGTGLQPGELVDIFVGGEHCAQATADADGNWGPVAIGVSSPCTPVEGEIISFLLNGEPTIETDVFAFAGAPQNVATGIVLTSVGTAPQLEGTLPSSGVAIAVWSGGTVAQLLPVAAAKGCNLTSLWTSEAGALVGYVVGAPTFVNSAFLNHHPGGVLPASTVLLLVCSSSSAPSIPSAGCTIQGRLIDTDTGQPIGGVTVGLVEYADDARDDLLVNPNAGTTDANGEFSISCDGIPMSRFPLRLTLTRSDWWAVWHTNVVVEVGGREGIQITTSLCEELKPLGSPVATDVLIGGGPTRRLTLVTNGNWAAYDFNPRVVSGNTSQGDFYVSHCGEPTFWANNNGPPYYQQGIVDLGDIGNAPLQSVVPPLSGYWNFGLEAVVGHTYVSRARQEFTGDYIVFRVVEIITDGLVVERYVLDYYYLAGP